MVKIIPKTKARTLAKEPKSASGAKLRCLSKDKKEFLIIPTQNQMFGLWEKVEEGWHELAVADSPYEMEAIIYPEKKDG